MAISVVMPALEMAQETGKLLAWRKKEGESVAKGEILLEIETDKAVMEIESPADGVLAGIKAEPGTDIPVGRTIAWIVRPGETPPQDLPLAESGRRMTSESSVATNVAPATATSTTGGARLSPKARRMAREHSIDIASLQGSGPGGAIIEKDILAAVQSRSASAAPTALQTLSSIAKIMAERTAQSWTTVPHFFLTRDVDVGALVQVREALSVDLGKSGGARPSHTDLLAFLLARVLTRHPLLNASWTGTGIQRNPEINIALAIAVEDGVVTAVIRNADKLDLGDLASQRRNLAERARSGKLRPADVSNGTFTISNLGMYNIDAFNAIITPPQAAILAVGRIADRVVPIDRQPVIRPTMTMTLSCDHRVVDGAKAALFLDDLAEAIRDPKALLA
jgi:pyruvate dehydrogenase E2 component (dihydrolipoamide acetyltransferase)